MKNFFNISLEWLQDHWRGVASTLIIAVIATLTLSLQLTTLVPGQNQFETETLNTIANSPWSWNNPVNSPYIIPTYFLGKAIGNTLQAGRIISVIYGLASTVFLFYVLKKWFNIRIATVGSLLFITSSWLLHISHIATPLILMIFTPLACLAAFTWLLRTKKFKIYAIIAFVASLGFAAYVPYMPWILLVTVAILVLQSRDKLKGIKKWQWAAGVGLYAFLVIPLILGLTKNQPAIKTLLGIPTALPTITQYLHNMANLALTPFFRSPLIPELHLGRLPLLDIFSTAMFILGIYYYTKRATNRRSQILLFSFLLLFLIIPLSPLYLLGATILMPLIYICIISGIVEPLQQWFSYFPRNPLARSIGVGLVVVAIGFTSFYHLQRYFIAWPNTPDTKSSYIVKNQVVPK